METHNTTQRRGNYKLPKNCTDKYLRNKFFTTQRYGLEMSPEFIAEIEKRMPQLFQIAAKSPSKHRASLDELCDSGVLTRYKMCIKSGRPIDDELNDEMAKRFPQQYDIENRCMRLHQKKQQKFIPYDTADTKETPENTNTETKRKTKIHFPNVSKNGIYNVTTKQVGTPTDGIQYINVFLNGKMFINNALDVKTLINDSVIAVQCIDKTDTKYWHLVNTQLQIIGYKFGPHIQIAKINDTGDALYLETTTRAIIKMSHESLNRDINTANRFVMNVR